MGGARDRRLPNGPGTVLRGVLSAARVVCHLDRRANAGVVFSLISAVIWHLAKALAGEVFTDPAIPYWNMATRIVFFVVVALLLSRVKGALERERTLAQRDQRW